MSRPITPTGNCQNSHPDYNITHDQLRKSDYSYFRHMKQGSAKLLQSIIEARA